jgi:hypothetical protein
MSSLCESRGLCHHVYLATNRAVHPLFFHEYINAIHQLVNSLRLDFALHLHQVSPFMHPRGVKECSRECFIVCQDKESFTVIVQTANGVSARWKSKFKITQQAVPVRTYKLGDHFIRLIDNEVTVQAEKNNELKNSD